MLINALGYQIERKDVPRSHGYDLEEEAYESIERVRSHTMVTDPRLVTLYQQTVFCEKHGIVGDFVECGTWRGGAVGLMALVNLKYGTHRRHLHLFDSFEGIPEPDASVDGEDAVRFARSLGGGTSGRLTPLTGAYTSVGTLDSNRELLEHIIGYPTDYLHYHKGWFQDTLPNVVTDMSDIAILRLDCDWYASTKICLEYLYDRVVRRGFVIIDDYGYYVGCRKAVDEFMHRKGIHAFLNHIDSTGRYWIKP